MPLPDPQPEIVTDLPPLPKRTPTMHKGQAGHVAILAGSTGMSGAAVLAGTGALRGGAGLVRILCPQSVQPLIAGAEPCFMTSPMPETIDGYMAAEAAGVLCEYLNWSHAIAIGPGMGRCPKTRNIETILEKVFADADAPIVLDAGALVPDLLSIIRTANESTDKACMREVESEADNGYRLIITPHPGEMARLREGAGLQKITGCDDESRLRTAQEYAQLANAVVVLKGHRTVVCTPDKAYLNETGNPGMAAGGMGDVLTGLIAALLAQGQKPFDAARLGVFLHGKSADILAQTIGPVGFLAREVADGLPATLKLVAQSH